jgi:hypothetical protein
LYGESLIEKFSFLLQKDKLLAPLVIYHRFISFSLYTAGFVAFVLTLKKTYYLKQFTLFGYTHLALLLIVTQSNLMIQNVFEGKFRILLIIVHFMVSLGINYSKKLSKQRNNQFLMHNRLSFLYRRTYI